MYHKGIEFTFIDFISLKTMAKKLGKKEYKKLCQTVDIKNFI